MQVMMEREGTQPPSGFIELDDAYIGGERPGKPGPGAENKTPFFAAIQATARGNKTSDCRWFSKQDD